MRLVILLFCCAVAVGQTTAPPPSEKPKDQDYGLGVGTVGTQRGTLDILSDTQGVDFGPYLERLMQDVRENWYHLIPESVEMKKGKLAIEFKIAKEGNVGLVGGTTDLAASLMLAGRFREFAAVVVATDRRSNDNVTALEVAATLKARGIDIICIGTDDADKDFLRRLATRSDLATHVSSKNLPAAITDASRFLPQG